MSEQISLVRMWRCGLVAAALGCLWEGPVMAKQPVLLYGFESEHEIRAVAEANDPGLKVEASRESAREGTRSLRVTMGGRAARAREGDGSVRAVRLPNLEGCDWTGAGVLCVEVFNPHDELFALDVEVFDGESQGYHRGYYDTRWHLVPGWTQLVVGLGDGFRHGEHKEDPMDRRDIRRIELTIRPDLWGERELFIDNVRLEAEGDEGAALEANARAVEEALARRMAAPERQEAEAAAVSLARKIEEAKGKGIDTIYAEAMLFVARLGLDWRARMAWFSGAEQQGMIHQYVREACARAEEELAEVAAGRRRPRTLTRHQPRELSLRGAYWYAGAEPVLVTAMLYNSAGPLMRFFHPHEVVPCLLTTAGASRYDVEQTPLYEAFKEHSDTHRVGWDQWCGHLIRDRWSMGGRNEEVVICLESPHMKHAMAQAIRARTPRPEARPEMLVHVMEGELSYCCYCEYTQDMFRRWLLERHGSLEAINETWGTQYEKVEDIRTPHHRDWDGNRARWYDFVDFNQQRFTQHHQWAKSRVREVDPVTPVTVGGIYYVFSPRQGLLGVDNEAWIDEVCETAEAEAGGEGTMPTDFMWAVCDGRKPIIDLEYHSDIFGWWPHFLHGYAVLAMWWWPGLDTADMLDTSVPHSPQIPLEEVEKLVVNALDIQRLSRYIIAFPAKRSPFALLYSKSSLLQSPPDAGRSNGYTRELARLYRATQALDAGRTFITERDLAQGQAGRFAVIAVPSVAHLAPEAFSYLLEFVQGGGSLLVTGEALRADQYARPADYLEQFGLAVSGELVGRAGGDESAERQPFGPGEPGWSAKLDREAYHFAEGDPSLLVGAGPRLAVKVGGEAETVARFEDGSPGLVRIPLGEGKVWYVGARLGEESLLSVVEMMLGESGVRPIVSVREATGGRPLDVEARGVEQEGAVLLYVINPRPEELKLTLETERRFEEIENLRTLERRPYGGMVSVPARDTGLFRLIGPAGEGGTG